MNKDIEMIWEKIETWDASHLDPKLGSRLNKPAPEAVVDDLNGRFGGILPADFLDSLRRHDGVAVWTTDFCRGWFLGVSELIERLDEMRGIAQDLDDADRRDGMLIDKSLTASGSVKNMFWSEHWIPFHGTDWSVTCFDFDPAKGGVVGQVIEVDWEGGWVKVVANNYTDFLRLCAEQLPEES